MTADTPIAAHPDAHGRGVGRVLLRFVEDCARALGQPEVRLLTNAMMWEKIVAPLPPAAD